MNPPARTAGILVSPEAGAAVVAAKRLRAGDYFGPDDEVVLFATGSGLTQVDMI